MKLDVIVPIFNEEGNIKDFYNKCEEELKGIKHSYIFINDGSTDNSLSLLKELYKNNDDNVKIISFSRNFGKEAAIYAGLSNSKSDYACIIDADLQQNPKYLVKMYNFLNENKDYDSVCMCQRQKKKRLFQHMFYKMMKKLSNMDIVDGASDFRMFRKNMVSSIIKICEKNRFSKGIFAYVGFNTYYDSYAVENRKSGNTKWNKNKLFNYAFDGIISFSTKPLRAATYTGLFISFVAFLYLIYIIVKTLLLGVDTPGFATIMCVMLFLGGINLIFLGILGEYLGKTYNETKNRPIYIEKEKYGFDEDVL